MLPLIFSVIWNNYLTFEFKWPIIIHRPTAMVPILENIVTLWHFCEYLARTYVCTYIFMVQNNIWNHTTIRLESTADWYRARLHAEWRNYVRVVDLQYKINVAVRHSHIDSSQCVGVILLGMNDWQSAVCSLTDSSLPTKFSVRRDARRLITRR